MRVVAKISGLTLVSLSAAADAAETITNTYDARGWPNRLRGPGASDDGSRVTAAKARPKVDCRGGGNGITELW